MYAKRIENIITKTAPNKYTLTTRHVFVPNHGSKVKFRKTEINPIKQTVMFYGTPPALRDISSIYETEIKNYYETMYHYKKTRRKFNKIYRQKRA